MSTLRPYLSVRDTILTILFVMVFGALFWPTFLWMAERFNISNSFYSHGWLIPWAGAWLIWQRRNRLQSMDRRASFHGLWLLLPSLILHIVATWWDVHVVSGLAMITAVWGLVWTLWGWQTLWTLRFPLLFLLFMVPLPGILLIAISFHMKLAAAALATHVLHLIGVPAMQAGSTINVPGVSVVVDDTCSGLRSLLSLIALSTFWIALLPASAKRWQRLTIVASAIPIALAANMVRIVFLVLVSAIYGTAAAEGFLHYGSGLVVFGVALASLAWLSAALVGSSVSLSHRGQPA